MDCSRFQSDLVELVDGTASGLGTDSMLERLGAHAESCDECRGARDLLEWGARPVETRDAGFEPDPAYWESFESRLHLRIDRFRAHRRIRLGWAVAAAVLAGVALVSVRALRSDRPDGVAGFDRPPTAEIAADAPFDALLGALDEWYGFDLEAPSRAALEPDPGDSLFPSTADLDADARQDLLDWLREEEARMAGGSV